MRTPPKEWIAEFIRWIDFEESLTVEEERNQVERAFAEATKKIPLPAHDPIAAERQRLRRKRLKKERKRS